MIFRSLRLLIHFSNGLFLLCLNVLPLPVNLLLLAVYAVYFREDFLGPGRASPVFDIRFFAAALAALLFVKFGYILTNGFHTVPNWDYHKYDYLLASIDSSFLRPSVFLMDGRLADIGHGAVVAQIAGAGTYPLAYYYAIYLPAVLLGKILNLAGLPKDIFVLQALFNLWHVLLAVWVLCNLRALLKEKGWLFFLLLFCLGGYDGLHVLLNKQAGGSLAGDIQFGGVSTYFWPVRIQDFASYFHWLPGHVLAALAGLLAIAALEHGTGSAEGRFLAVSLTLFILSTSALVFLPYGLYLFFTLGKWRFSRKHLAVYWERLPNASARLFDIVLASAVTAAMAFFYLWHKSAAGGSGYLLSFNLKAVGPGKLLLAYAVELFPFAAAGILLKIRDIRYVLSVAAIAVLCLIGNTDLIMTPSILAVFFMIYRIALAFDPRNKRALAAMILLALLYLPSQAANVGDILDLGHQRKNPMSVNDVLIGDSTTLIKVHGALARYVRSP